MRPAIHSTTLQTHGIPRSAIPTNVITFEHGGLGDELLCTAICHELTRAGRDRPWILTHHPELFKWNPDVGEVLAPTEELFRNLALRGVDVHRPNYENGIAGSTKPEPTKHIIKVMCGAVGIEGKIRLTPYFYFSDKECGAEIMPKVDIILHSSAASARWAMQNKEWFPERFSEVAIALRKDFRVGQVGSIRDPLLQGVIDLRGRLSIRETAALLAGALVFVGLVGFPMHLARSVNCRSVIVYGGREHPSQTGYSCNENLCTLLRCAPCWLHDSCDYDRRCMREIRSESVIEAVLRQVSRANQPLEVDWAEIGPKCLGSYCEQT